MFPPNKYPAGPPRREAVFFKTFLTVTVCALGLGVALPLPAQPESSKPNILLIVVDDLGIEHVADYGLRLQDLAPLARLHERLNAIGGDNWRRFDRAWSNPYCSPTRATFLTGLYGKETGIGDLINEWPADVILDTSDPYLLARLLQNDGYATGAFGKWHLGLKPDRSDAAPIEAGFDRYDGTYIRHNDYQPCAAADPYLDFEWTTAFFDEILQQPVVDTERICREEPDPGDCDTVDTTAYLTTRTVDAFAAWLATQTQPWFAYIAFQAPHAPWSCPPEDVYLDGDTYPGCDPLINPDPDTLDKYYGMLKVVDQQIDRLLSLQGVDISPNGDTYVFLLSDNGSPDDPALALPPVNPNRVKGTVFEGGVRVPFFVAGPDVVDGALTDDSYHVNVSDVYATILDLAGLTNPRLAWEVEQSQSFRTYMVESVPNPVRACIYTEFFQPNGIPGAETDIYNRAVAGITASSGGDLYKYVEVLGGSGIALFNLSDKEWDDSNLCPPPNGCDALQDQIVSELIACRDTFEEFCGLSDLGEPCTYSSDCCAGLVCSATSQTCANAL